MRLGDSVTFIRHNQDGFHEGTALVKGMGLDGSGREVALLKDAQGNSFNAFIKCLNRDKAFHDSFRAGIEEIQKLSDECTEKQKAMIADYNARIDGVYEPLIGKPLEI